MAQPKIVRTSFTSGGSIFTKGSVVAGDSPFVRRFPEFFEDPAGSPLVEQATAAPGETRATPPRKAPAKKAPAKKASGRKAK